MILNFCNVIPAGIVVFVPSFSYLSTLINHLQSHNTLEKIKAKKATFSEPQSTAEAEEIFKQYRSACKANVRLHFSIHVHTIVLRAHIWLVHFYSVSWVGRCQKASISEMNSDGTWKQMRSSSCFPLGVFWCWGCHFQIAMIQSFKNGCVTSMKPRKLL